MVWVSFYRGAGDDQGQSGKEALASHPRNGIAWWLGLLVLTVLLVLPNFMAAKLSKVWLGIPGLDKLAHFFAFVVVFVTVYGVWRSQVWPAAERGKLIAAVVFSLVVALGDEVQQALLGRGRTAESGDLVADAAGVIVGLTCVTAGQLGMKRAFAIVGLLLVLVGGVTFRTYQDLKHFNRGMVYEREHDYQRARTEYLLALDSGFQSAELYNTIAWLDIEFLDSHPAEAEQFAARALAIDPGNPDILDTYGWVLVKIGRAREGLPLLEKAKVLKPNMYCIDLHLGEAYRNVGDRAHASEYLKRQIERNSTDRWGRSAKSALDQLEGTEGDDGRRG